MTEQQANQPNLGEQTCPRCGASFTCDVAAGKRRCWCFDLPRAMSLVEATREGCLCANCLREAIDSIEAKTS